MTPWVEDVMPESGASRNGSQLMLDYQVTFDGKTLVLPQEPAREDTAGLCRWLTSVFNLDREHPISGGERQGPKGPDGHVALHRAGASEIRFEPVDAGRPIVRHF